MRMLPPDTATGYDTTRLVEYHNTAIAAVKSAHRKGGSPFVGYRRVGDKARVFLFRTRQEAAAWYQAQKPDHSYTAFFDATDLNAPLADRLAEVTHDRYVVQAPRVEGVADVPPTAKVMLDDRQRLHTTIHLNGGRFTTSINFAPTITIVMNDFAHAYAALPPHMKPSLQVSGEIVLGAIEKAIEVAGDALIAALTRDNWS